MAFRVKHWLGVVAVSLALIAVWRLPLDYVTPGRAFDRTPEEIRHDALVKELREARSILDQVRRAERLPELVLSAADDRVSVIVPEHRELTPGNTARLRELIRAEVEGLGARDPSMVVGYAYDGAGGGTTGLAVSQGARLETYVAESNGTPYCMQVVVTRPGMVGSQVQNDIQGTGWSRRTGTPLGPCAFFAKHGLAGPAIHSWLEAGGIDFAFARRGATELSDDALYRPVMRRNFMAARVMVGFGSAMEGGRCMTGDAEACAAIFIEPDRVDPAGARQRSVTRRSPATYAGSFNSGPFFYQGGYLLSDLEGEFGAEAFQRFWTSDTDVRTAFEAAFGVNLGEWVVEWAEEQLGLRPHTPAPTLSATLGSILCVTLLTGLVTFVQQRRRVA